MPRVVIAAGGTAGHVVPALAVADELRARGAEPLFAGARGRAEEQLVPAAGLRDLVPGGARHRPPQSAACDGRDRAGRRCRRRSARPAGPGGGGRGAGRRRLRRRPGRDLPPSHGARRWCCRRPTVTWGSRTGCWRRSRAGCASRSRSRAATASATWSRAVRSRATSWRPTATQPASGWACRPTRVACWCSAAASARAASTWRRSRRSATRMPSCCTSRAAVTSPRCRRELGDAPPNYRSFEYLDTLADPLAASDLVVARAGGSIFEIAAAGRPAILVPYPAATADHQTGNARWMQDAGAAEVLRDAELTAERLRGDVQSCSATRHAWSRWRLHRDHSQSRTPPRALPTKC